MTSDTKRTNRRPVTCGFVVSEGGLPTATTGDFNLAIDINTSEQAFLVPQPVRKPGLR